jgi:hypothetical protein
MGPWHRPCWIGRRADAARARARSALAIVLAWLLAGCLPDAVTEKGRRVYELYRLFMAAAAAVFAIVVGRCRPWW